MDELFLKEIWLWGQSKISSYCFFVWCHSRFHCVTPLVEIFSSDKITFLIPSRIKNGAPPRKLPMGLIRWLFPQKSPLQTSDWIPNADKAKVLDGLQVLGNGSCRLMYKEVIEVQSNYKKSYFSWFRNPANTTESNTINQSNTKLCCNH